MKVLITGICGFVGSSIAKAWIDADTDITIYGLDNFIRPGSEYNRNHLQNLGIKLFHGDIRMASDFDALPAVNWVIDAAANPSVLAGVDGTTSSRQLIEHNLLGTVNILEYCKRHCAGFILLSTSRVYSIAALVDMKVEAVGKAFHLKKKQQLPIGISPAGVNELFSTASPISLYGSSKLASEVLAKEYGESFGFPVWINRCGVLAGAGQFGRADQGIFTYWINAWMKRQPISYIGFGGNGYQVRDCFHPRDLLSLLQKQTSTSGDQITRLLNLGGGSENAMSLAELSDWCADRFGNHTVGKVPDVRRFDMPWLIMDYSLATEIWEWKPQTSLHAILDEIAHYAEQNPNWLEISGIR